MTNYRDAGVDIEKGDLASKLAYFAAKKTFVGREKKIGAAVEIDGGFSGVLDFGDFFLLQNDDGVGTKSAIADAVGKFDTLGRDLLAMVADDAVCCGAETISITNTIDTEKVDEKKIEKLMNGLAAAALEQKIIIAGGEIAELGNLVRGFLWNATAVAIVEKEKIILGEKILPGDKIIGLHSNIFRSNGISLVRKILRDNFGEKKFTEKFDEKKNWGEIALAPSKIFSAAVLEMTGRFREKRICEIRGIAHITGGGLPGNLPRILKKNGLGAKLQNLPNPHPAALELQKMGKISDREIYKTWNMGVGMALVAPQNEVSKILKIAAKNKIAATEIGEIFSEKKIEIISRGAEKFGQKLEFKI